MISAGEFRNGVTVDVDGDILVIIEFQHVKPGKGAAFVRTKLRNLVTGAVLERTFRPTEKFPRAHIDRKDMQYLYRDGSLYYFMDNDSYEQQAVDASDVGDSLRYIKENEIVKVMSYNGSVFGIEPPAIVELLITDTEPGFKGDTAQNATKPAQTESGATVNVPLFVNSGDTVRVDTRTGDYLGRA